MKIRIVILCILFCLMVIMAAGCYTPQGGSSIPWNKPASWEGKTLFPATI